MWDLKNGSKRCPLKIKSKILFFLFFVAGSVSCFSLSPDEVDTLKELSPEVLINIILIYDEAQNDLDRYLMRAEEGLIPALMELQKARALLTKQETESVLQKNLYQMLLNQHESEMEAEYERGLKTGITIGSFGGGIISGSFAIGIEKAITH